MDSTALHVTPSSTSGGLLLLIVVINVRVKWWSVIFVRERRPGVIWWNRQFYMSARSALLLTPTRRLLFSSRSHGIIDASRCITTSRDLKLRVADSERADEHTTRIQECILWFLLHARYISGAPGYLSHLTCWTSWNSLNIHGSDKESLDKRCPLQYESGQLVHAKVLEVELLTSYFEWSLQR